MATSGSISVPIHYEITVGGQPPVSAAFGGGTMTTGGSFGPVSGTSVPWPLIGTPCFPANPQTPFGLEDDSIEKWNEFIKAQDAKSGEIRIKFEDYQRYVRIAALVRILIPKMLLAVGDGDIVKVHAIQEALTLLQGDGEPSYDEILTDILDVLDRTRQDTEG